MIEQGETSMTMKHCVLLKKWGRMDEQIKKLNKNIMGFRINVGFICQSNAGS